MNYIIIGEPCIDMIHHKDGSVTKSYGGILYSLITSAVLSSPDDTVYPLMNIGGDEYENIKEILGKYTKISTEGINKAEHTTKKVHLYDSDYRSSKLARIECLQEGDYTLAYEKAEGFLKKADAVLINMISGADITLDTLKKIRSGFDGYIHMDIHNLVMKTNSKGFREHANLENWREWCTNTDTLQMNEFEIGILSREKRNDYEIAEELLINLNRSMAGVIVTKGRTGVSGFTRKEKVFGKEKFYDLDRYDVAAVETPRIKDITGCGDVFAASFMTDYSKNTDFKKSLHYATRIASFKTSLKGIEELDKLK
ncbi:MAG: carbohydrate kinase family protein [Ignavibacteria bacterium]|nr:carbohydrate kinase family protein [Ignavibacteria bacterium]